jgi:hypothetical protein
MRKVTVTATRYYYKQVEVEVDVPDDIVEDSLIDFLSENQNLDDEIEERISEVSLTPSQTNYRFDDGDFGGHL